MEILKFVLLGIIGATLAMTLRQQRPEIALVISILTAVMLIGVALDKVFGLLEGIKELCNKYSLSYGYISVAVKVVCIALICDLGMQLCKDAGEGAIAAKVELCGKLLIAGLSLPILSQLLEMASEILSL